jgi:hypothetical protein
MKTCMALSISILCGSSAAIADRIVLSNGDAVIGKVQGDHIEVETSSGHLSVPYGSLKQVSFTDAGAVKIELVDGTTLEGTMAVEKVSVHQALFDRVFPVHDIRTIAWDPPKVTIPAGTAVPLALVRTLTSKSTQAGTPVELCVTRPVVIDGKTVIAGRAAAWGEVLGASTGRNIRGGKLVLRATGVTAVDGSELPLSGTVEAEGGFNGEAVAALGVVGLLAEGNPAETPSGIELDAKVERDADVALTPHPANAARAAAQRDCDEYFSLAAGEFVPVEKLRHGRAFAPVSQPLRVFLPVLHIVASPQRYSQSIAVGTLWMEDLSILTANLEISPKRKGGAELTIVTSVHVRKSQDRLVNLEYQLVAGDQLVKSFHQSNIKAAEGRTTQADVAVDLTAAELATLSAAPDPRLRISMTAIED